MSVVPAEVREDRGASRPDDATRKAEERIGQIYADRAGWRRKILRLGFAAFVATPMASNALYYGSSLPRATNPRSSSSSAAPRLGTPPAASPA
jgi:hypothetical protein